MNKSKIITGGSILLNIILLIVISIMYMNSNKQEKLPDIPASLFGNYLRLVVPSVKSVTTDEYLKINSYKKNPGSDSEPGFLLSDDKNIITVEYFVDGGNMETFYLYSSNNKEWYGRNDNRDNPKKIHIYVLNDKKRIVVDIRTKKTTFSNTFKKV